MTARRPFPHTVIRASAGTGKTFQLSNRYIALVAAGEPVDDILAVTFARKAAGEILDRILLRLAEAGLDSDKRDELARFLKAPSLSGDECLQMLERLTRRLHRLRVGTLDSFFAQMAGSFSLELGLPPGWTIVDELDDREMRDEAIRAVLQGESTAELVTLMHLLSKGDVARSVTDEIREIVDGLYDLYCQTDEQAWRRLPRLKQLGGHELQAALEKLSALSFSDKRFAKAHNGDVAAARSDDWSAFISSGLAARIADGQSMYYNKPIGVEALEAYGPLIEHARAVLIGQLASQTEATRQLLDKFDSVYQQMKHRRRGLRFEDVTLSLMRGLSGRIDEVAWRLDGHVRHLLLDEFQDTSLAQWNVVKPFAERVTRAGSGRSFFCVGDVKQAIYGWRGGVSAIFDAVAEQLEDIQESALTKSYRSSQPVIDTVNRVFDHLPANEILHDYPTVARLWKQRFQNHRTAKSDLPGYCCLRTASRAVELTDQPAETLKDAARQVKALTERNPGRTIGVLVRKNAAVARLIYELRANQQVRASEEGGNPLTDSAAVQLILSLLRLADHPGSSAARFHVATSPLAKAVGLDRHDDGTGALRLSLRIRDRLLKKGYGATIYKWASALAEECDERELGRLLQLVELAYQYESDATCRVDDFVRVVENRRVEDPAAAQVRVMTFHQAKGLQFDIVVLPELDFDLKGMPPKVVTGRQTPLAPVNLVCRYANQNVQGLLPEPFQRAFDNWADEAVNESLCLLYVAMTRAVYALYMIIPPPRHNERTLPRNFSGLLRAALTDGSRPDGGQVLFEHGDWHEVCRSETPGGEPQAGGRRKPPGEHRQADAGCSSTAPGFEHVEVRVRQVPTRRRGLDRQSPSAQHGGATVDLSRRLRLGQSAAMTRGSLFHEWFELVEWLDDGEPDDEQLEKVAGRFVGAALNIPAEIGRFRQMVRRPEIRKILSRSGYTEPQALEWPGDVCRRIEAGDVEFQLRRECPFAYRQEDALWRGTIDRLVEVRAGGVPIAADIIDFKTDSIEQADQAGIEAKAEEYGLQLQAYRQAVARLTNLEPQRISARLLFLGTGKISVVPAET